MKKKTIVISIIAVIILLSVTAVYASVNYGSESDPLITKSYLDKILVPSLQKEFDEKLNEAVNSAGLNSSGTITVTGDEFTVLTLTLGQTVTCKPGCEFIPRIGAVSSKGSDFPAVVDTTTAKSHGDGVKLNENHLYMVTINGCGFKATEGNVIKVLIKGSYTVN